MVQENGSTISVLADGRELRIHEDRKGKWYTGYDDGGVVKRLARKALPKRDSWEEAEGDLRIYAADKGLAVMDKALEEVVADLQEPPKEKRDRILKTLECRLTDSEKMAAAKEFAVQLNEAKRLNLELKSVTAEMRQKIKEAMSTVNTKAEEVRTGVQKRDVDCDRVYDYDAGEVRVIRLDTDEVIEERRMLTHERQTELPGTAPANEEDEDNDAEIQEQLDGIIDPKQVDDRAEERAELQALGLREPPSDTALAINIIEARQRGARSYELGKRLDDNFYPGRCEWMWCAWRVGWKRACRENGEPLPGEKAEDTQAEDSDGGEQ